MTFFQHFAENIKRRYQQFYQIYPYNSLFEIDIVTIIELTKLVQSLSYLYLYNGANYYNLQGQRPYTYNLLNNSAKP